jgi:outer membrane immunogenic protein
MLRQGVVALLATFAVASSASAGDFGRHPGSIKDAPATYRSPLWQGFYIGGNVGYGWGENDGDYKAYNPHGKQYPTGPLNYDLPADGSFAGFQMGFNRRAGNFVFGLEADIQTSNVGGGSTTFFDPPVISDATYTVSRNVDWFGTVRGRVGYARDHMLIYATAGLAFGQVDYSGQYLITEPCCGTGNFADHKSSKFATGYVIGGGIERALNSNWSLKLEYQYINLGDASAPGELYLACGKPSGEHGEPDFDTGFHTVRVGLNYRFHRDPPTPLK